MDACWTRQRTPKRFGDNTVARDVDNGFPNIAGEIARWPHFFYNPDIMNKGG